jgi:hypothetical protein
VLILKNAEFLYNNLVYIIISASLFFTLYNYHPNAELFIKEEVLKDDILTTRERGEEIVMIYKTLSK